MTIHGLKSELEQSKCHENRDNALIDAPLNSESHKKQEVKTFLDVSRSTWSEKVWGWQPYNGRRLKTRAGGYE